jgi:ubiquinone/menaquinone biosynthesis C-methylase UbiE
MVWLIFMQWLMIGFLLIIFFACVLIRLVRRYRKFPIPSVLTQLIDNPWRRRLVQRPSTVANQLYLKSGMVVVEIGPGKGSYTIEFSKWVLPNGKVFAIDISESVIARLKQRIAQEEISNIIPQIGNAYDLSFDNESVDRVIAITCLPEIPEPVKVLREIRRILKPDGLLSLSELAPDPDYPRRKTVKRWASEAGFVLHSEYGNWFVYQLNFKKA